MSATSRGNVHGRRGGGWLPPGPITHGRVDGVTADCPTPVYVRCACGPAWVVPSKANKPCDVCQEPQVPVVVEPRSA